MVTQYKNLIGGKMVGTDRWLDVVNPANEQVIGQVPHCGKAELDKAVAAARAADAARRHRPVGAHLMLFGWLRRRIAQAKLEQDQESKSD